MLTTIAACGSYFFFIILIVGSRLVAITNSFFSCLCFASYGKYQIVFSWSFVVKDTGHVTLDTKQPNKKTLFFPFIFHLGVLCVWLRLLPFLQRIKSREFRVEAKLSSFFPFHFVLLYSPTRSSLILFGGGWLVECILPQSRSSEQ